jgi:hypothetical protein
MKNYGESSDLLRDLTRMLVLQDLAALFKRLLSVESWPVRAHAMSSLHGFGVSLHTSNHSMLKSCLPDAQVGLLQCRVQGLVLRDSRSCQVRISVMYQYSMALGLTRS